MSGMINSQDGAQGGAQAATPASGLGNPLLQQTEDDIEAKLKPENRANYMKIVVAGMHIALANGPNGFAGKLRTSRDPIGDCARGAVDLLFIMRKESKGVMPMQAGIPAAMTLMLHGLDLIDRAKIAKVDANVLAQATQIFGNALLHKSGITPQMLQTATQNVHGIMQDPAKMALINQKAGVTKHPDLNVTPTPVPGQRPGGQGVVPG